MLQHLAGNVALLTDLRMVMIQSAVQLGLWRDFIHAVLVKNHPQQGSQQERHRHIQIGCFLTVCGHQTKISEAGGQWVEAFSQAPIKCSRICDVYPILKEIYAAESG